MQSSMTIWYNPNHPEWYDGGIREGLDAIRRAGFTHINWNPDAGSSYIYSRGEMEHIADLIRGAELGVKTLHAAHGHHRVMEISSPHLDRRKDFTSPLEWRRRAGIELVENRLIMARILGCDNVVLHVPLIGTPEGTPDEGFTANLFRAFDALRPAAEREGVSIAVENLSDSPRAACALLEGLFERYPKEYMGWCYDSGHAHLTGFTFPLLHAFRERMTATHLHDCFGARDDHLLPGDGNLDWDEAVRLIAESSYEMPLNFETPPERYSCSIECFYERAYAVIGDLTRRVEERRVSG